MTGSLVVTALSGFMVVSAMIIYAAARPMTFCMATAALMIQENDDPQVPEDILDCLDRLIPAGGWRHDRIDNNGAAHIQAGIVGPSEAIPVRDGALALSRWQNVFLCDFDGPRRARRVLVTITGE